MIGGAAKEKKKIGGREGVGARGGGRPLEEEGEQVEYCIMC